MTKIALAQMTGRPGAADANRECTVGAIREATALGAELVVLPELVVSGYTVDRESLESAAEPVDGPTLAAWADAAASTGALVVGGFCEREGDRLYNSVVGVGPDGRILHYRKLHLFAGEKDVFTAGDLGLPIARTPLGTLGVCVCYDLRFVEVVRVLALRGVELVCVPTAWTAGFDRDDGRTHGCPQSDGAQLQGNLNQIYLACASQAGSEGGFSFLGSSIVVGPTGRAILGPRGRTEEGWVGAVDLDLGAAVTAQTRGAGITPRLDRRTDVYALRYGDEVL